MAPTGALFSIPLMPQLGFQRNAKHMGQAGLGVFAVQESFIVA